MTRIRSISAVQLTFARLRPARRGYTPGYGSLAVRWHVLGPGRDRLAWARIWTCDFCSLAQAGPMGGSGWLRLGRSSSGAGRRSSRRPRRMVKDGAGTSTNAERSGASVASGAGVEDANQRSPSASHPSPIFRTRGLMADTQNVRSSRRCPAFVAIALNGAWARRREVLQSHGDTGSANAPLQQHN